jgi:hypothetical protein
MGSQKFLLLELLLELFGHLQIKEYHLKIKFLHQFLFMEIVLELITKATEIWVEIVVLEIEFQKLIVVIN